MQKNRRAEAAWIPLGLNEWVTTSEKWKMNDKLFKFSPLSRSFTLDMAFRGIKIYGANGSGKTSGFARVIASSYLDHGFGGLVLCAKGDDDELKNWVSLCKNSGRSKSLIHFGPKNTKQKLSFNILEFIRTLTANKNESQMNLVKILKMISNDLQGGKLSQSDSFWDGLTDQYLTHLLTITFSNYPDESLTFKNLSTVFKNIQTNPKELGRTIKTELTTDIQNSVEFFTTEFPAINDKTRSIIVAAVSSMLFKFNTGLLADLFGKEGNVDPKWTFGGAIFVINIPTNEFHELGKTANLIWKYAFQKACLARKSKHDFMRPVFLWADEAQEFIHPDDVKFQATARSTRCSTVYLTQNIAGLRFGLGSGIKASDAIKSMEANLLTTIFHQNIDLETNEYASKTIGTKKEKVVSTSSKGAFSSEVTKNVSYRDAPIFKQEDFLNLKSGGPTNKKLVESIVFVPGGKLFLNPLELGLKDWHKIIVTQGKYDYFLKRSKGKLDANFQGYLEKLQPAQSPEEAIVK